MLSKLKIIIPLSLLLIFGLVLFFDVWNAPDNLVHDYLFAREHDVSDNIIIVGLDERSIMEIGTYPWPRYFIADTISKVSNMGAAAIGVNILYDMYSIEDYDNALVEAAAGTDRLVLGGAAALGEASHFSGFYAEDYILNFDELDEVVTTGFLNLETDTDGVMRNALVCIRYGDVLIYSLAYETYIVYCRAMNITPNDIKTNDLGQFPINYASRPGGYRVVSLWGVLNDEYDPSLFENAIVLIGPYTQAIGDSGYLTTLHKSSPTYSVEINANIIQNMLEGNFKQDAAWWLDFLIFVIFGAAVLIVLPKRKPLFGAVFTVGLIILLLAGAALTYSFAGIILRVGDTSIFLILCWLSNLILGIVAAQSEKNYVQNLFGRFVSPDVVNEMVSGGIDIQLGGIEKEITVLFVDIRGFTAFSEANPADKVVSMVNRYLELTSKSIQDNGGTIDKYIGDATMAVFNAPNDLPDHALCAVKAAWEMKQGSVMLREEILRDYGVDLQFGIGINTGNAVVGNMGCEFRMDYTAIGDTVNTAARLESNSEKGQILLSDSTYQLVRGHVEVTDLGILSVKNKKTGIQIYGLEKVLED